MRVRVLDSAEKDLEEGYRFCERQSSWGLVCMCRTRKEGVPLGHPPTIDGIDVDEFIRRNADPIWLHQNEMWEHMVGEDES